MRYLCLVGLLIVAACAGKSSTSGQALDGGPGPGGGVTVEQACEHDANSYCDKQAACSAFTLQSFWGDLAKCKERDKLWCAPALAIPGTGLTPESLDACAAAVDAQTCDDFNDAILPEACKTKPGARAAGQPCTSSGQCQTFLCRAPANSTCLVCTTKMPLGGACMANSDCESGSRCRQQKCIPEVGEGAMCGSTVAVCKYPNTCLGVCTKPLKPGAACDPMLDACDYGTFGALCDPQTSTCKAAVKLAAAGQPCGAVDGGQTDCSAFGSCEYATPTDVVGTCKGPIADGAPCDMTTDQCFWPASCVNGVCKLPGPTSAPPGCPG